MQLLGDQIFWPAVELHRGGDAYGTENVNILINNNVGLSRDINVFWTLVTVTSFDRGYSGYDGHVCRWNLSFQCEVSLSFALTCSHP